LRPFPAFPPIFNKTVAGTGAFVALKLSILAISLPSSFRNMSILLKV
jgi:hypothetical protein